MINFGFGLLLPTSKLIIHSQGNTFLETTFVVRCESYNEILHLESKTHVEIFRDVF
jgi:hypothetical protein